MDRVVTWLTGIDRRRLPPPHLRQRVGRKRLLFDQVDFFAAGTNFWLHAFAAGWADLRSDIVEIACGSGRYTGPLADLNWYGDAFEGTYLGIDLDPELVEWCRRRFTRDGFSFAVAKGRSELYRADGQDVPPNIPAADASADLVLAGSLFTHLLDPEATGYLREAARVLRPGGRIALSAFCLEHLRAQGQLGERWTFEHRRGQAYVESLQYPEAAVAYDHDWLVDEARAAGFDAVELRPGPQSMLLGRLATSR